MGACREEKVAGERGCTRDTCEYVCMYENQIDKKMEKREKKEEIGGEEEFYAEKTLRDVKVISLSLLHPT